MPQVLPLRHDGRSWVPQSCESPDPKVGDRAVAQVRSFYTLGVM
jgi:hypothetical protein